MWSNKQEVAARELITREMHTGIEKHGLFLTEHEGWAVIDEEFRESAKEVKHLRATVKAMRKAVYQDYDNIAYGLAYSIYTYAFRGMLELMQTAAMAEKYMESFQEEDTGTGAT